MKEMIEIIRKATELNEMKENDDRVKKNQDATNYINGEIQILEFLIENTLIPEEKKDVVMQMYDAAFVQYKELNPDDGEDKRVRMETLGATDILAWVLELPQKEHDNRKKANSMLV